MTEFMDDANLFFYSCLALRIFEAFGCISHICSSYTFIIKLFPDDISYVFSLTETACGVGLAMGPAIGGLIYSQSGYGAPFYIFGSIVLICFPLSRHFINEVDDNDSIEDNKSINNNSQGD